MKIKFFIIFLLTLMIQSKEVYNPREVSAVLKTCSGWGLGKLPQVKEFIFHDSTDYPLEIVYCGGDPYISFIDSHGNILSEHKIKTFTRSRIANLLEDHGFHKYSD